jgi:hypothetical protein
MLSLEWIANRPVDGDGGKPYVMHYLVDHLSKRCFATIAEPRDGNFLFVTDIRVAGVDRSYIDLEAAKQYCEGIALEDDMACAKQAGENIRSADGLELLPKDGPSPLRKFLAMIRK